MINKKLLDINVIKAYLSADYSVTTSGVYEKVPLNRSTQIGKKLTLNNNGQVVVGTGVSYVEISAKAILAGSYVTTGGKNLVVQKNGSIVDRTWLNFETKHNDNISLPATIIEVQEGDIITLGYYGVKNDSLSGGIAFTHLTVKSIM